jgi:hypothetical protein
LTVWGSHIHEKMNIRPIIYSLFIFILAVSCSSDQEVLPLNKELVEPTSRLVLVDTLSIGVSTVVLDSITTSGKDLLLAGKYNDPRLGNIISKSYFQVSFPKYTISKDEIFDSISLIIAYNGYSHGDTTQLQKLTVRRLTEKLQIKEQTSFYNTTSFDYSETPLGELIFYPKPATKEKISIRLDGDFGKEIFDYLNQAQDDEFKDDEFNNFFKGLVLVPDEMTGNSIIGYQVTDTSLLVRIYTHTVENELTNHEINFPVINKNLQFNQINCDWSNNPVFINHRQRNAIPVSETGNVSFINAGLGMFTRLSFPTIASMIELENSVLIRAVLYIKPALGANVELPDGNSFTIYQTGKNNGLDALLVNPDGTFVQPKLSIDELYNEQTWYSFDITDHLITEFSDGYIDPKKALSITFSSSFISNSLDQLLVGGSENKTIEPRLELLFLFYDLN